jgi:hypothetical protein
MNRILLLFFFIPFFALAQVPQGVGYQGVATDANGIELVNQAISIRASVLSGSATGTIEWEETHATSTDTFGLFTLTIGQGTNTTNSTQTSFADISWGTNTHFLKIEMDVTGGSNYSFMGTNQMMSVPYALYAESANINYDSISNILSNDSTFITTVGGGMGGGCDYTFPQGLEGTIVTHDFNNGQYTVPTGKNLYITYLYRSSNGAVQINSVDILHLSNNGNSTYGAVNDINLYLTENDIINTNTSGGSAFQGVLIDNNNVLPICQNLNGSSYTVPLGKKLFIKLLYNRSISNDVLLNGIEIGQGEINHNGNVAEDVISNTTLILEAGDLIEGVGGYKCSFNGYLVDENYFAACGGGGNNNTGGGSSTNDDGVGDFTDNSQIVGGRVFFIKPNSESISSLYETDSSASFENLLYTFAETGSITMEEIFIDEVNQDLYFLATPHSSAISTFVMKTSLSNFNPQTIYVIPIELSQITEFKIHPVTGLMYFSKENGGPYIGLNYYDPSSNQIISLVGTEVDAFCFNPSGDVFYVTGNALIEATSGNTICSASNIYNVFYNPTTSSFILQSSTQIFTDQGSLIYNSEVGSIRDMDIDYVNQKIIFNAGYTSASIDIDGSNLNYNAIHQKEPTAISFED